MTERIFEPIVRVVNDGFELPCACRYNETHDEEDCDTTHYCVGVKDVTIGVDEEGDYVSFEANYICENCGKTISYWQTFRSDGDCEYEFDPDDEE